MHLGRFAKQGLAALRPNAAPNSASRCFCTTVRPLLHSQSATAAPVKPFSSNILHSASPRRYLTTQAQSQIPPENLGAMPTVPPFPIEGLLPKDATQAAEFIKKFPTYDGRNIRVAVLDTGVDPAARGLDGEGKVVDVIDCSGAGDVPLVPVEPSSTSSGATELISPTTGRKLLVDASWKAKSSDTPWLVGFKRAYELWPRDLNARRQAERKKNWDVENAKLLSKAQRDLTDMENVKGTRTPPKGKDDGAASPSSEKESQAAKSAQKEELKARVKALQDLTSSFKDVGPLLEVVTFYDGSHWRTVVGGAEGDIRESTRGWPEESLKKLDDQVIDLRKSKALADFRIEQQHDQFGSADMLTYSVNHVFESSQDETVPSAVSLVTLTGSHGTHVAAIIGANVPDSPQENGVAPNVEIVSLRIGDERLNGMETGQALLRAAQALIATNCHICNMSFGEAGAWGLEGKGKFAEAMRDIVIRQKDILFVSSAGNAAPALTTLGMPAGTTEGVITIGAYVTAGAMLDAEYSLVEKGQKDSPTTWSSRGPGADGARGTTVYAPGAAITSIPKYQLQSTQLMNGTSMSSPNACGAISLLLSGMQQSGIPITSARVAKALTATAKDFNDELGVGFLQVMKAWEYIVANKDRADADFEFKVRATPAGKPPGGNSDKRGVYLRELAECSRSNTYTVTIKPSIKGTEPEQAYGLQLKCSLSSSTSWVSTPDFLLLGGNGRSFEIRVDPSRLPPGLHTATIKAFDSDQPGFELFEVPITVAKPEQPSAATVKYSTTLKSGGIHRNFLAVPNGVTWVEARFRSSNHANPGVAAKFWAHLVTIEQQRRLPECEQAFVLALNENEPVTKKFAVKGGQTLEVCLAEMWNAVQAFDIDVDIEFHGITVGHAVSGRDELTLIGGEGMAKIECTSNVRIEAFKPSISFSKRRTFVRPASSEIRPLLDPRNLHPTGKMIHELVNTYSFTAAEAGAVKFSWPTSGNLYDSATTMLTCIFETASKKLVAWGDVYPKDVELAKGEHSVRVQWLSEDPAVLKSLKTCTMKADQKLSKGKDVSLSLYEDHYDAYSSAKAAKFSGNLKLFPGERKVLTLDLNLHGDALPKEAQPGDVLIGDFGFAPEGKYELRYIVPPSAKKEDDTPAPPEKEGPQLPELLAPLVKKLKGDEKDTFLSSLLRDHPTSLPILLASLDALDATSAKDADKVISTSDQILAQVDENAILLHLGEKKLPVAEQDDEYRRKSKKVEEEKKAAIAAYVKKGRAILTKRDEGEKTKAQQPQTADDGSDAFKATFTAARRFLGDSTDNKEWVHLRIARLLQPPTSQATSPGGDAKAEATSERLAQALLLVRSSLSSLGAGDASSAEELRRARAKEVDLLTRLGWNLWSAHKQREAILADQKDWALF